MSKDIVIGDMIAKYMKKNNMTMKELGEKVGKSESSVSYWISGKSMPRMGVIQQLADFFGISTDSLIYGDQAITLYNDTNRITDPVSALKYLLSNPGFAAYGGYDISKMTDDELTSFANEVADYTKYIADRKYKKK